MERIDLSSGNGRPPADEDGARAVLVVGTDDWAVGDAVSRLRAAGKAVFRCCDSVDAPFPCNALLRGRSCPLDTQPIDVVVTVRPRPHGRPGLGEMGAICGVRSGLPLVTAGVASVTDFAPWSTPVPLEGDLVTTCDEVVRDRRAAPAGERR